MILSYAVARELARQLAAGTETPAAAARRAAEARERPDLLFFPSWLRSAAAANCALPHVPRETLLVF